MGSTNDPLDFQEEQSGSSTFRDFKLRFPADGFRGSTEERLLILREMTMDVAGQVSTVRHYGNQVATAYHALALRLDLGLERQTTDVKAKMDEQGRAWTSKLQEQTGVLSRQIDPILKLDADVRRIAGSARRVAFLTMSGILASLPSGLIVIRLTLGHWPWAH